MKERNVKNILYLGLITALKLFISAAIASVLWILLNDYNDVFPIDYAKIKGLAFIVFVGSVMASPALILCALPLCIFLIYNKVSNVFIWTISLSIIASAFAVLMNLYQGIALQHAENSIFTFTITGFFTSLIMWLFTWGKPQREDILYIRRSG